MWGLTSLRVKIYLFQNKLNSYIPPKVGDISSFMPIEPERISLAFRGLSDEEEEKDGELDEPGEGLEDDPADDDLDSGDSVE